MCYNQLIYIIFLFFGIYASSACTNAWSQKNSCRTSPISELTHGKDLYQDLSTQSNSLKKSGLGENSCYSETLQKLQKASLQKVNELKNNKEFQEIVTELQNKSPSRSSDSHGLNTAHKADLLIFVSFSMGKKALLNLAYEAERFGATLILRGFKDGSYKKTAQALHEIILKTGQGVLIDPELYILFKVSAVPTFILTRPFQLQAEERIQTPLHDKLQGHVSTPYALEMFAKEGDLKEEAHALLSKGAGP